MRLGAAEPGQREAVPDLDALDRLDAHHRRREARVEPRLARRVRAETRRDASHSHLDDPAERVAIRARRVDRLRIGAVLTPRRALDVHVDLV